MNSFDLIFELSESHRHRCCGSQMLKFVSNRSSIFLTPKECDQLLALTFLDADSPFGLQDRISHVGKVGVTDNQFTNRLNEALELCERSNFSAKLVNQFVKCIVPLTTASDGSDLRADGSGKSVHWLKGAIFLSLPLNSSFSRLNLALNIVHEAGHQLLMIAQDADSLIEDIEQPIYSAIRKTWRPAIMSLHALVAIHCMRILVSDLLQSPEAMSAEECSYVLSKSKELDHAFAMGALALKDVEFSMLGLSLFHSMLSWNTELKSGVA